MSAGHAPAGRHHRLRQPAGRARERHSFPPPPAIFHYRQGFFLRRRDKAGRQGGRRSSAMRRMRCMLSCRDEILRHALPGLYQH